MLHVLGLILKIIGILILIILGLILLLIGVILFVPISYEVKGEFPEDKGEMKVSANVHWLFRLLRVKVMFYHKELDGHIRIAWKKISLKDDKTPKKEKKKKSDKKKKKSEKKEEKTVEKTVEKQVESVENKPIEEKTISTEESSDSKAEKVSIKKKIGALLEKIKCTFRNICDKIKEVKAKKDKLQDFINDPILKSSVLRVKKEIHWIVRFLKPKKIRASLRFGFEDPSTTGLTLAALSMIYPFTGDDMEIVPDFEHAVLNGNIYVKGRLYLFYLVVFAVKLILDKNVRALIKKLKK